MDLTQFHVENWEENRYHLPWTMSVLLTRLVVSFSTSMASRSATTNMYSKETCDKTRHNACIVRWPPIANACIVRWPPTANACIVRWPPTANACIVRWPLLPMHVLRDGPYCQCLYCEMTPYCQCLYCEMTPYCQ